MTMIIYLDILKELETHFKMRYDWLKSEERPVSYSILKKPHKSKNPAELIVKLSSCQVVKLSSCQVVKLSSCQVVKLKNERLTNLEYLGNNNNNNNKPGIPR